MSLSQQLAIKYIRTKFKLLSAISKRKAAEKAFRLFCTPQYRNKKKLPRIFAQAEVIKFKFLHYTIQGYRWNELADKRVLILHGFESSVINFDRYVKPLIRKGYCVLAFDAPAHGRSSGKEINVLIYKDFIDHINHRYGPVKNFIAHSFGGLALSLAIEKWDHDESFKIVYIAPAVETQTAISNFFNFLNMGQGVRKEFEQIIEERGSYQPGWYSIARAANHIKAKVLFFQDKDDDMTPLSDVEPIIKANHSNFKFILTEGLGHRRIYKDNKVSKAIIDFF